MGLQFLLQVLKWFRENQAKLGELVVYVVAVWNALEVLVGKIKEIFASAPELQAVSTLSDDQKVEVLAAMLSEELEAAGLRGDRIKKLIEFAKPIIREYLLPFLMKELIGAGASVNKQAQEIADKAGPDEQPKKHYEMTLETGHLNADMK